MKRLTFTLALVVALWSGRAGAEPAPTEAPADPSAGSAAASASSADAGGEDEPGETAPPPADAARSAPTESGASVLSMLQQRLSLEGGVPAKVVILKPLDYTKAGLADKVDKILGVGFKRFAKVEIVFSDYRLEELTLEQFRLAALRTEATLVVATVLKPSGFEAFLYDRRNPYVIYTYALNLPDPRIHQYSKQVVITHTKQLLARLLNNYVKDHYYELPRLQRQVATDRMPNSEQIPRSPAAIEMYFAANNDIKSSFYGAGSMGYMLSKGATGKTWNSALFSAQIAYRFTDTLYAELAGEVSAYTVGILSLKYLMETRDSQWRYLLGFGLAYATAKLTASWDQTNDIGYTSMYAVPSFAVMMPVGRTTYVKAETRAFVDFEFKRMFLTFMPGLLVRF